MPLSHSELHERINSYNPETLGLVLFIATTLAIAGFFYCY